jgi:hypothetical protein
VYPIFTSSPSISFVKGSFTTYSSVVRRTRRDERFACPHSEVIVHFLFWGAGSLGQSILHCFVQSKAHSNLL